ncbi:unnamed protein product [Rotaria magnacalcarata]|uniref:EF-hand domain-containing protein n=1 Tax=Rotaria magnacalcarata TaxID=392030 RepID=A0A816NLX9_9BILA|nr:unnamed protein product [Rotaria magnacalcarata]CAF3741853.1 unnamed protein product [Rotaria magnacalcarata]
MNDPSPDLISNVDIHQSLNQNQLSYDELFRQVDKNNDGKIDVNELIQLLEKVHVETCPKKRVALARRIIDQGSGSSDASSLTFQQFADYVLKQEKKLSLVFRNVDAAHQGKFDAEDLVFYFKKLGITVELAEAKKLVEKMDQDNSLQISFDEWRSFFMANPAMLDSVTNDPHEMLHYWRSASYVDLGESPYGAPEDALTEGGKWWKNLIAGGIAGAVSRTATAPFDRLKIIMQYLGSRQRMSVLNGYRYLIKEGGVISLWRGNGVNVLKIIPETALRFAFFEEAKKRLKRMQNKELSTETTIVERFAAGAFAGFLSQTVVYPLDVLKVRLCLRRTGEFSHWTDAVKRMYRFEGPKAFWRGYVLNQVGIIPFAGFDLACYETLKNLYIKKHNHQEPPIYVVLGCGAISSFTGQLVTYPIALLRTRRQGQIVPLPNMDQSKAHPVIPATQMLKEIWHNEGIVGLYRGLVPNILKVIPSVSISYLVYETVIKAIP